MEETQGSSPTIPKPGVDLLSQVHKRRLPEAPPGFYKSLSLDFFIVIFAAVAGVVFQQFWAGQIALVWMLIASGVFAAFSVLGSLLTKNLGHRILVILLEGLAFLLPLLGLPIDMLVICFAVFFILLFWGEGLAREDRENSVEIRFFRTIHRPLSKIISALVLVGVILFLPIWSQSSSLISQPVFNSVFGLTTNLAGALYPEYQFGSTLDAFTTSIAKGQLSKDPQFILLPPAIQTKVLADASSKLLGQFSATAGIQLNPEYTFSTVAYTFLNNSLNDLRIKFGTDFIVLWALIIFLIIRGIAALFAYLIALLAFLLYHFLISMRIIRVTTENKPHEVVEFF